MTKEWYQLTDKEKEESLQLLTNVIANCDDSMSAEEAKAKLMKIIAEEVQKNLE